MDHSSTIGDNEDLQTLSAIDFTLDIDQIVAIPNVTCALLSDKQLRCWGSRDFFRGSYQDVTPSNPVILSGPWSQTSKSCALQASGDVSVFVISRL